jgi:hypothetical protein
MTTATPLTILHPSPKFPRATLIEPTTLGYLYIGAAVHPGAPLVGASEKRTAILALANRWARDLRRVPGVVQVDVFRAIVMPPTGRFSAYLRERHGAVHVANFDVIVLIQASSPERAREVESGPAFVALRKVLETGADDVRVIAARNVRRMGDVDMTRPGLFLFNHFAAADPEVMLELWEYLAGWYAVETGLDNSVAMAPLEGEFPDYTIINWARWDSWALPHFWRQLSRPSFWRYVTANLDANHAASMPIYCRRVEAA